MLKKSLKISSSNPRKMVLLKTLCLFILLNVFSQIVCENEKEEIEKILSSCKKKSPEFDACIKRSLNKIRPYFNTGIPSLGVASFDPHFATSVSQRRELPGGGGSYALTLTDVYEGGWTQSVVTKFKTDWDNQSIIYSQYFPEKWLKGNYDFKGAMLGLSTRRAGAWNLTLRDYSQTTRVARRGAGVGVRVRIDRIGDMDLHIGNLAGGRTFIESMMDRVINVSWKPGLALLRPLLDDLVSTAFTDIWSQSFKDFPLDDFIHD